MNNRLPQTISTLIWRSVMQAIIVAVLIGLFLSFIYGLLSNYKQKHQHIDQIATLLTTSASTADSADIVAEQVKFLLENEPSIQSILFYSTPQPIDNLDQSAADWKNVLFADTVSFNYPVTSNYIDINSDSNELNSNSYASQTLSERINEASETNQATTDSVLVGYINITLDMQAMREYWYRTNLLGLLIIIIIAVLWVLCILRKLKWPVRDIESLTEVCEVVLENPSIDQLPVISQHFNFQDLILIKRTFVVLFNRLQKVKQDYEAVVAFEQQLHTKDISLDVQLHNFQSMITHELKTSLNAIVGGLQLLDHDALNREQKDAVEIISSGSEKLVSSLDHIIQLNQIKKGQIHINYSEFNPLQLIADILVEFEPIAQKKGLELVSRVHHIDYSLKGDAEKIQQILSILLSNAIKFTPVGQVIITSQLTHFDKSNRWQISVKDTGIGIDSHHIDDIFNPFFQVDSSKTRQYEGSGVGLPIVKQMIQLMGATIEVESTLGVGTQFIITIAMPTIQHSWQQSLLAGLTFIYYYYDEVGFLGAELEHLGAVVIYCQHEKLVLDEMKANKVDMVMFAEDIFPRKAESLASRIRKAEDDHRALLVYWYSPHQAQYLDSFEHGLKVAGIDYCCSAIYKDKDLSDLLQRWLVWK